MMSEQPSQLSLSIGLRDDATFANFYPGQNRQALQVVEQLALMTPGIEHFVYLWGGEGAGCSHLLQAACQAVDEPCRSFYLPLEEVAHYGGSVLDGLEAYDLVCLDHLDAVAGEPAWEEALFHLYNRIRDCGSRLLLAARQPPRQLPMELPDLVSRLSWGLCFQVQPLGDDDKAEALRLRAHARGLHLGSDVIQYILHRSPRGMGCLYAILERLDRASLAAKRKITIPFVKQTLEW